MIRFDSQFLKWLMFGAVAAVVADAVLYPVELLVIQQRDAGTLEAPVALGLVALLAAVLTVAALVLIGERAWAGVAVAAIAAVIAYFIGATHLAALSLGVSLATFGDRRARLGAAQPKKVSRARAAPDAPRPVARRRRRRRR
jgi:hypothetical protein